MTMANTDRTMHVHAFMAETTGLTMVGNLSSVATFERLVGGGASSARCREDVSVRSPYGDACRVPRCGFASDGDGVGLVDVECERLKCTAAMVWMFVTRLGAGMR